MRSFDPRAVGRLECRAWETHYRWLACLVTFVGLVRAAFRMRWPRTVAGAWLRVDGGGLPAVGSAPCARALAPVRSYAALPAVVHR